MSEAMMKKLSLFLVTVFISTASVGFADNGSVPAVPGPSNDPVVVLPKMTITAKRTDPSLLIPRNDLTEASFARGDPVVGFPSQARFKRIFDGRAAVGVMVDAEGNATDFLVVRYSESYFAEEVINALRNERFTPRKIKGIAVPGRFYVVRAFSLDNPNQTGIGNFGGTYPATVSMNPMEQMEERSNRVTNSKDGPPLIYKAHGEYEIDGHILEVAAVATPAIPAGLETTTSHALTIVVSFYVDEKGDVRLPSVDSNSPALMVASVIKTVSDWKFVPPTIKGKPVLVFTSRTLILEPNPAPNSFVH
jgi:outer membrane biosynthesis protein TonB